MVRRYGSSFLRVAISDDHVMAEAPPTGYHGAYWWLLASSAFRSLWYQHKSKNAAQSALGGNNHRTLSYLTPYANLFQQEIRVGSYEFVDLQPVFLSGYTESWERSEFKIDGDWNAHANELAARTVAREFEDFPMRGVRPAATGLAQEFSAR